MSDNLDYITVKDASKMFGRSESTIRNLLAAMTPQQRKKYTVKKGRKVLIHKEYLGRNYDIVDSTNKDEIIENLTASLNQLTENQKQELNKRDRQIASLMQIEKMKLIRDNLQLIDKMMSKGANIDSLAKLLGMSRKEFDEITELIDISND